MSDPNDFLNKATNYWISKGSYLTDSRRAVCHLISLLGHDFEFRDIEFLSKKVNTPVAYATIYRVVAELIDSGVIVESPQRVGGRRLFSINVEKRLLRKA